MVQRVLTRQTGALPRASVLRVEVAIVGAGIAGCTLAYELASLGVRVAVFDQASIAASSSGRNTGTLLHQPEPQVAAMLARSVQIYQELEAQTFDLELREHPQLLLARDAAQLEAARARAAGLEAGGTLSEFVGADEMAKSFPALAPELAGGFVVPGAWTLHAEAATRAFAEAARQRGAMIRTGQRVGLMLPRRGDRETGLVTDDGLVVADVIVVATGAAVPELLPQVPVAPGRGWLMRTTPLPWALPWIIEEISWSDQVVLGCVTRSPTLADIGRETFGAPVVQAFVLAPQVDGSTFLGASLAPSLRDAVEGVDAPRLLSARACSVAPALGETRITRAWSALRPMTVDGLPIAGRSPVEGVWVHGGHGSLGMQAAPATAEWLAATITGSRHAAPQLAWLPPERLLATQDRPAF